MFDLGSTITHIHALANLRPASRFFEGLHVLGAGTRPSVQVTQDDHCKLQRFGVVCHPSSPVYGSVTGICLI